MLILKADTAVTLKIGPFIDDTDGKTAETGLTITQAEVRLSKNGANIAQKNEATNCTHDELGIYGCPIDTTDTNTEGRLQLWVHKSGALPVFHEYMVVNANVFDSLYAAATTDYLQIDALQLGGVTQSATDLKDFADTGYNPATHKVAGVVLADGCTANTDMRGTDNVVLAGPTKAEMDTAHALLATEAKQDIIDTVVDGIQTDLSNTTDGLGALKTLIEAVPTASEIQTEMEENGASLLDTIRDELANGTDGLTALKALIDAAQGDITTIAGYTDILDHATNGLANIKSLIDALDTVADAIKDKTDLLPSEPAKNVALGNFTFLMVLASDHITPATGKTITSQISKDGGAFANCTNSVSEIANGFYKISLTQTEMNANIVALKFTETNCDQRSIVMVTST